MPTTEKDSYGSNIKGTLRRSILPEKVLDVGRFDVTMEAESTVMGSIMCRNLELKDTPFQIDGSVMALGSVKAKIGEDDGSVLGPLVAANSILTDREKTSGTFRVVGDVSSMRVNLDGAFIYGNIFGSNVTLKNCVVLGSIHASQRLEMSRVVCFTFVASQVKIREEVYLLNYAATAVEELNLEGELYVITNIPWREGASGRPLENLRLTEHDIKDLQAEKEQGQVENVHIASLFDRIVDLSSCQEQLATNISWVEDSVIELNRLRFMPDKSREFETAFAKFITHRL